MTNQRNKVAIVTGASSGIGKVTAQSLAEAGFTVIGTSRKTQNETVNGINMMVCDVTDELSVRQLTETVIAQYGQIDLLVNNAGIGLFGAAEESSVDQVKALYEVNVFGVVRMTNAVLPIMRQQRSGQIINISSVLGFIPSPYSAHYAATKHAVEGYSESLDHELREYGIKVSLIEPALTKSSFEQSAMTPDVLLSEYENARADFDAVFKKANEVADSPQIVADVVVLAATEKATKTRYPAGKTAKQVSFARRFIPTNMFDKSLRKQLGLK